MWLCYLDLGVSVRYGYASNISIFNFFEKFFMYLEDLWKVICLTHVRMCITKVLDIGASRKMKNRSNLNSTSRSAPLPLRNGLYFDDRFLVQETSRRIGWSCYHLKNPACQVTEEGPCGELKTVLTMEIRPINHQDKEKGKSYCMQEKSSQALGGQYEAQASDASEGKEPCLSAKDNRDGNASSSAVNFDITRPFASSEIGGEVSFEKKKQTYQLETEMAGYRKEDTIPEKKMEPGNSSEKSIEDENGTERTRTLCCPVNYEYLIPPENEGFEGHRMQGGIGLESTVAEMKEKPRRERKRKEGDQSGDANWSIEMFMGNQASKEGSSSKRGKHSANGKNGSGERQESRRGRTRKIISQSAFTL